MNDKRVNQYLILPEAGQRKDTKLAVEYDEEQIADYLKQGYVIVNQADFNKLIGNADGEYLIADDGSVYPKPAPTDAELLAVAKPAKISELKAIRDTKEVEPVQTDKGVFDYDDKSRDRLYIARQALTDAGSSEIVWTTADNQRVSMGIADFAAINGAAAVRSNALHIKYNELKQRVNAAQTVEEVEAIGWRISE